jgi:chromosome segregation ATPase
MENEIRDSGEERKKLQLRAIQVQDELKWQVAKLTQESEEIKKSSQLAEARASHAERELEQSRQEQSGATRELETLRQELSSVSSEVGGLRQELTAAQSSLESERRKLRDVGERFAISERERVELQRQMPVTGDKPAPAEPPPQSTETGAV